MTLTEFLLARITEDEKRANYYDPYGAMIGPARMRAECEAKRARLDLADSIETSRRDGMHDLAALIRKIEALPYAGHPDYDEAWRP